MTTRTASVPDPGAVLGPVRQAVGTVAGQGAAGVMDGLGQWLFSSLADLTSSVFSFVDKATRPNVTAGWFIDGTTGSGPYRAMATVAATIVGVLLFGGIVQGVAQGDVGGMVRRMAIHLPVAVIGITGGVVVVQVLVDLTDGVASYLTSSVGVDSSAFLTSIQKIATEGGATGAPTVVLGLLMLVAALVVFIELLVRSLLIYLIVALSPLAWAALVWPALQSALRKTLELLVAVILSKVVVALAISVGAAAMSASALAGEPAPELAGFYFAEPGSPAASAAPDAQPPGDTTEALGILAMGVATLAIAAFSPFLIARLLPFAEAATVAQGTRGGPFRASQQAFSTTQQLSLNRRLSGRASLAAPTRGGGGAGGTPTSSTTRGPARSEVAARGSRVAPSGASAASGAVSITPITAAVAVGMAATRTGKAAAGRAQSSADNQTTSRPRPMNSGAAPEHGSTPSVRAVPRPSVVADQSESAKRDAP